MKINRQIILTMLALIIYTSIYSQGVGFSYQAVALDKSKAEGFGFDTEGEVLANTNISVKFSISEGSTEGPILFEELHHTKTDIFGMFRLIVGRGDQLTNTELLSLDWGEVPYFLHIRISLRNGGYEYLGSEELLGSPYALNISNQQLTINGNELSISNGNTIKLVDNDAANELQSISKTGNVVTLSDSGGSFVDEVNDADASVTNEIQDLQLIAHTLSITSNSQATSIDLSQYLDNTDTQLTETQVDAYVDNNGYLRSEGDSSITNELQDLQLVAHTLSITSNSQATSIDLSQYLDNTDTQLTEAQVDAYVDNNGYLRSEVDSSITNELQELQLIGNTLTITKNTSRKTIDLAKYNVFATVGGLTSNAPGDLASDDFLFGSTQLAHDSNPDHNNRVFFDKSKASFRAGASISTEWDDDNIGLYTTAFGRQVLVSGSYSFAAGLGCTVSGAVSFATGQNTVASGGRAFACGLASEASGNYSFASGNNTIASNIGAFSTGWETLAQGAGAIVSGFNTTAMSYSEAVLGSYNTIYEPASKDHFNLKDRLFVLGNGSSLQTSDALIVYKNGNATLSGILTEISDARLKTQITPLENSLENIENLEGIHYKWNEVKPHDTQSLQTGLIAQDVERILPELVIENAEGYKSVNYIGLIPHLIEAVKTLKAKHESTISQLENRLNELEALVREMRTMISDQAP